MKILSLDTAMACCSAAIIDTDRPMPLAAAQVAMERGHAEALAPMVAEVLAASGLEPSAIGRVAVTTGPGTFTGVRIGLAFARGFGLARGVAVTGIDTLSAIAANEEAARPLLVAADARNGEIYAALFDEARRVLLAPQVTTPERAAGVLPPAALIIGSGAEAVLAAAQGHETQRSRAGDLPVAARFARLAAGLPPGPMPAPLYLRAPDAKPQAAPLRRASGLVFATAGAEAAALMAALHAETFEESWTAEAFADLLHMPGAMALLARENGEPSAFLLARAALDEAEIITLGTRPTAQRRGVAQALLAHGAALLREAGVRQLFLEVAASNVAALGLYAAQGFREAGRRKGYYHRAGGREDAIVMRKELAP